MGISTSLANRPRENSASFGGHRQHRDLDEDNDSTFSASGSDVILSSSSSPQAWAVIRSETLATWKYGAVLWGFDPRIDYTSNVKARLQPWCTAGRHLIIRHSRDSTPARLVLQRPHCILTIIEGCFRQDTFVRLPSSYATRLHIEPDPAGHYLKSAQVTYSFYHAVLYITAVCAMVKWLAVHLLVCLSRSSIVWKGLNVSSNFFHLASPTILVFMCETLWRNSNWVPLNGDIKCRWCVKKTGFPRISHFLVCYRVFVIINNNNCFY